MSPGRYLMAAPILQLVFFIHVSGAELEYCVSTTSMLAEIFWQIAEGFMEVLANL